MLSKWEAEKVIESHVNSASTYMMLPICLHKIKPGSEYKYT